MIRGGGLRAVARPGKSVREGARLNERARDRDVVLAEPGIYELEELVREEIEKVCSRLRVPRLLARESEILHHELGGAGDGVVLRNEPIEPRGQYTAARVPLREQFPHRTGVEPGPGGNSGCLTEREDCRCDDQLIARFRDLSGAERAKMPRGAEQAENRDRLRRIMDGAADHDR